MSRHNNLLIEIGTEELPPKNLSRMMNSFGKNFEQALKDARLSFRQVICYATPRRLALEVVELADRQPDQNVEKRGPAIDKAYDEEGNPSKAALGFMRSCNVEDISSLDTMETKKGAWLVYRDQQPGIHLNSLIDELISASLAKLPIDRKMRWGAKRAEFVRPVHWLVAIYGTEILPAKAFGIQSSNLSQGHRFMSNGLITIPSAQDYTSCLLKGKVVVGFEARKQLIRNQLEIISQTNSATVVLDEDLLDEVTSLVEWPVALVGSFNSTFLEIPEEALISAMKSHQRYFHMVDKSNKLLPKFITIANIESNNPASVIQGNERVIAPRLSDAVFFFNKDKQSSLATNLDRLKEIIFQSKLGTYFDKAQRIAKVAGFIARDIGANPAHAERAGLLCKSDLVSAMVGEFTDLQGLMGGYYAEHDNEPAEVCNAIAEHYKPTASGANLPSTLTGQCVAIADKIDTITGLFGIDQPPTGSRDPYAIRRQTLGVIRICIENKLPINIKTLIEHSNSIHGQDFQSENVVEYFIMRLGTWYQEQGINQDTFNAIRLSTKPITNLYETHLSVGILDQLKSESEFLDLIATNKRIANILKKVTISELSVVSPKLFVEEAESRLANAIEHTRLQLTKTADFRQQLLVLATIQADIEQYFNDVMVMSKEEKLKNNRLATMAKIKELFLSVADLTVLQ
ncbi:MAG: glycine--tRNA ligase subunit beta [Pseudomonadales bacterium]|nr:glycine--tRNA ligase subunit beta [Pseudomonadales bacterium]